MYARDVCATRVSANAVDQGLYDANIFSFHQGLYFIHVFEGDLFTETRRNTCIILNMIILYRKQSIGLDLYRNKLD